MKKVGRPKGTKSAYKKWDTLALDKLRANIDKGLDYCADLFGIKRASVWMVCTRYDIAMPSAPQEYASGFTVCYEVQRAVVGGWHTVTDKYDYMQQAKAMMEDLELTGGVYRIKKYRR